MCRHPVTAEARNVEFPDPGFQAFDQGIAGCAGIVERRAAQQPAEPGVLLQRGILRLARLQRLDVYPRPVCASVMPESRAA